MVGEITYPHPGSATVFILAHAGAQRTVDDFLPKWEALPARLVFSLPEEEYLERVQISMRCGANAYAGREVFRRFIMTLDAALLTASEHIVIAEYDTVPLRPVLPKISPGKVMSYYVVAEGPVIGQGLQFCALSPWAMDRPAAIALLEACQKEIEENPDYPEGKGLLDRWLGHVIIKHKVPREMSMDVLGYPWHEGAHDRIRWMGFNWIHGWKTKEEFGDLWT
jgi:hypothetical protein